MKQKFCWVATETRKGWRLRACIGPKDYHLTGLLLKGPKEIEKLLKGNIVFIERRKA